MAIHQPANMEGLHRIVARDLSLGLSIEDICEARALPIGTWRRIANSPMMQTRVRELSKQLDSRFVEEAAEDPIRGLLKVESLRAVRRLVEERDQFDPEMGASSSTRISAANSILDKAGYGKVSDAKPPQAVFVISGEKVNILAMQGQTPIEKKPDVVDLH